MLPITRELAAEDPQEDSEQIPLGGDTWTTLDKTVRRIDEEKVKDCKDDMDTLLVFAGLYSAVLTAFLIESYQNLIQDPQQTMIQLLGQIASQTSSYTISGGFLNSTALPLPPPSPFHAAITDVRVNVCWFASLILSLSTASFGILVKQWLREYLAVDCTVPQERIRIRHFRYIGLNEWKLFEIAAALPVVLQISLALFFTGLCFFTSEIHPSVRTTSLCLVSGWALLFSFTFLAPLVSARCPYKTTFLKSAFRRVRPHARTSIKALAQFIHQSAIPVLSLIPPLLSHFRQFLLRFLCTFMGGVVTVMRHALSTIRRPTLAVPEGEPADGQEIIEDMEQPEDGESPDQTDDIGRSERHTLLDEYQIISRSIKKYVLAEYATIQEEEEIRRAEGSDLVIFKNVDSILLDDRLLRAMREALRRSRPPGKEVLKFVASAIDVRLSIQANANDNKPVYHDKSAGFGGLPSTTCAVLLNILTDVLERAMAEGTAVAFWDIGRLPWMNDAVRVIIALVPPRHPTPVSVTSLFRHLFESSPAFKYSASVGFVINIIDCANTTDDWQLLVLATITDVLKTVEEDALLHFLHVSRDRANGTPGIAYRIGLIELASSILHAMFTMSEVTNSKRLDGLKAAYIKKLLEFVFGGIRVIEEIDESGLSFALSRAGLHMRGAVPVYDMIVAFLTTKKLRPSIHFSPVSLLLECLEAQSRLFPPKSSQKILWKLLNTAMHSVPNEHRTDVLSNVAEYFEARQNLEARLSTVLITLRLYLAFWSPSSYNSDEYKPLWKRISYAFIACIAKGRSFLQASTSLDNSDATAEEQRLATSEVAYSILRLCDRYYVDGMRPYRDVRRPGRRGVSSLTKDELVDENDRYSRWAKQFDAGNSFCPDELFATLREVSHSTTDSRGRKFWRVRRVEDIEREAQRIDGNAATSTIATSSLHVHQGVVGESTVIAGREVMSTDETGESRDSESGRMNRLDIWATTSEFSFVPPCN